jgi:diaminopimelate epimerase
MHGLGNDYIYIDGSRYAVDDPASLAREMADRHFGIGGDGLILILPPADGVDADVRMRMFNADGSEAEMCGNGIRCVCKYAHDHGLSAARPMRIQAGAGVLAIDYTLDERNRVVTATVDMGEPMLDLEQIPAAATHLSAAVGGEWVLEVLGERYAGTLVSMGNPHIVLFVDDLDAVDLERIGPVIERHDAFPNRINVHVVRADRPDEVTMRTWERGSGVTLACGTGACAVCVAGVVRGRTDRRVRAHLPGGDLEIEWRAADGHVLMTGSAVEVFSGDWPLW